MVDGIDTSPSTCTESHQGQEVTFQKTEYLKRKENRQKHLETEKEMPCSDLLSSPESSSAVDKAEEVIPSHPPWGSEISSI